MFITQYETESEILNLPTPDGTWQTNDISDYMEDDTALGVVIRMTNNPGAGAVAIRGVDSSYDYPIQNVGANTYMHGIVNLKGNGILETNLETGKNPTFYITAEIHDEHGVFLETEITHQSTEEDHLNAWRTIQITPPSPYTYADIHAVILRVYGVGQGDYGVRAIDTDPALMRCAIAAGNYWHLVETDSNGEFEFYSGGKFFVIANFYALPIEVGYVLKGSGIVIVGEPIDENPPIETGWGELDLSGTVPNGGDVAGMYIENTLLPSANKAAYVRATGVASPLRRSVQKVSSVSPTVLLDSARKCEYKSAVDEMEFRVMWWQGEGPRAIDAEAAIRPGIGTRAFAGPAVDAGAGFGTAVGATVSAGPALDADAEFRPAMGGRARMGEN